MEEKLLKEIKSLLKIFNGFINSNFELILDKKRNIYTNLNLLKSSDDLIKNILEWKSRYCCSFNDKETNVFRSKINMFLNDNYRITFSKEEFLKIYIELGNGINEELSRKFINSNFDLKVLNKNNEKQFVKDLGELTIPELHGVISALEKHFDIYEHKEKK